MTEHKGAEMKSDDRDASRATGACPDCGAKLQKGYLASGGGLSWSPTPVWTFWKGSLIVSWFKKSKKCVTKAGAYNLPADRCRKCSILVLRY